MSRAAIKSSWSAALALLWVASAAHAQASEDVALRVASDAAGCTTEAALRARLRELKVRGHAGGKLEVRIDAASEPVVLELRRDGVVLATRRFEALPARCEERLETLAVVIALAVEHAAEPPEAEAPVEDALPAEEDPAPVEPEPAEPARAPPEPPVEEQPQPEPVEREPPSLLIIAGAGGAYGLLPELAGVASVGVELPTESLRIGLSALASTQTNTELAGGSARAQLAGARAYGCAYGAAIGLDLQACAGLALGVVTGSGRGYASTDDATGTLLAPLLRLGARFPARGVASVGLAVEGFTNLVRPELQVSGHAGGKASVPALGASCVVEAVLALP